MPNPPSDLEPLFHDSEGLRNMNNISKEAQKYTIPCVFDLEKHEKQIDFLFDYMSKNILELYRIGKMTL